jgi:hypothetical protein
MSAMYLVLKPSKAADEDRVFPVHSETVFRALSAIRTVHAAEEAKLDQAERRELANALQILAVATLLELQLDAIAPNQRGD